MHLDLNQEFFYEGDPMWVRITVQNDADRSQTNPVSGPLYKGFKVRAVGGNEIPASGKATADEPERPKELVPRSFYGAVIDLSALYPKLREAGTYQIHWAGEGLLSEQLTVNVIPKYDPEATYKSIIDTDFGAIEVTFFQDQAPIATKAFIDMANAGFYDGLQFTELRKDTYVVGGAPRNRKPFIYPAEQSTLPLVAGTVVMKPVGASPPANGSEFIILLRPQPALSGQVTVLGQVVKGLDVVQKISEQPNSGQAVRPFFKPLKDIGIRGIKTSREDAPR